MNGMKVGDLDSKNLVLAGEDRLTFATDDHPAIPRAKVGILVGNLGTPDATDYWSMRRYLGEFLSDRRVIDYSPFIWQPLLQLIILTKRPFSSGAASVSYTHLTLPTSVIVLITVGAG